MASRVPRRLLSINSYHSPKGGADHLYFEHAQLMTTRGWEAVHFAMRHPDNLPDVNDNLFCETVDPAGTSGLMNRALAATRVVYNLNARRQLGRLLDQTDVAVAHVHNIYHHLSPSILDELAARDIPVVLTAHDLKLLCPAYSMLRDGAVCEDCKGGKIINVMRHRCIKGSLLGSSVVLAEAAIHRLRRTYKRGLVRIVVPSRFYLNKFIEWGWDEDQLVYIPNFVSVPASVTHTSNASGAFLYAGRLSAEKGVATLIRAAARAETAVDIAGDGPERAKLEALALDLGASVRFLGRLSQGEVTAAMKAARALVLPSEWYENAPLSVLEAFAAGTPVIGAKIGGIPELVTPEVGWTFRSADPDALAAVLETVAALSTNELAQFGRCSKARVRDHFSAEIYAERIEALYATVMS